MRTYPHPSQQMQVQGVLSSMEVRGPSSFVREVRVRARHGEDVEDAKDPSRTRGGEEAQAEARNSSPCWHCQSLNSIRKCGIHSWIEQVSGLCRTQQWPLFEPFAFPTAFKEFLLISNGLFL